jgi:hypothetical protein
MPFLPRGSRGQRPQENELSYNFNYLLKKNIRCNLLVSKTINVLLMSHCAVP